ncbi:S41 family peptidase [Brevundimonas aurifodinae]|uniref:Tricorn protease homolog n=2 Tax=Brevundimonas TaxID=41275 RepID=A0ABV1NP82_9CAUL|nr:MAG: protease [Brevundimonas subvibrioides]
MVFDLRSFAVAAMASASVLALTAGSAEAQSAILQQPTMSASQVAFVYGGDLWTVPRAGGRAQRLTVGVGVESGPVFSPDGRTLAFTGEYDGNIDVYTVPVAGGLPRRITYHPGNDAAVGWSPDGAKVLFRSNRSAASRYTQLFAVDAEGGAPEAMPLPYAYAGHMSGDGRAIAYSPFQAAFGFDFSSYVAWGNYRGGRASTINVTTLDGLDTIEIPQVDGSNDLSPVWMGGMIYFLSDRDGPISIYSYDPASQAVASVWTNDGPQIRSLSTDGTALVFDRLGEIFTLTAGGQPQAIRVDVAGDMPDARPRILNVADQIQSVVLSPSAARVAVEARGEILSVPAMRGAVRNLTNTPGVMERSPAWSPDGQKVAYFSDESGLYALHVAPQNGEGEVRRFPLAPEPTYYFEPVWSPDSRKVAFYDNALRNWVLDTTTGRLTQVGQAQTHGGFTEVSSDMAWSPDSRWLVYSRNGENRLTALHLFNVESGSSTQITSDMGDARFPTFDRGGDYLYYVGSNNFGAATYRLDMSSNLYTPTHSIYAVALNAGTPSPVAPLNDDEGAAPPETPEAPPSTGPQPTPPPSGPIAVDLAGQSLDAIQRRTVALPIPVRPYAGLTAGKPGVLFFLEETTPAGATGPADMALNRFTLKDRKVERLAERVMSFDLSANGETMLVATRAGGGEAAPGTPPRPPTYAVVPANAPIKAGEGAVSFDQLDVRIDPRAEWAQMYREVFRMQRAYFYDPGFHGSDLAAVERELQPFADAVLSRTDLNYVFHEALTGMSVGHLRGGGGTIATARRVPGGLLGADYAVQGGRWCITRIYGPTVFSPDVVGPLAQPGIDARVGDCVLSVNDMAVTTDMDIQQALEGTAGRLVTLRLGSASGAGARDVSVQPIASEARLRYLDWIEGNRRRVDELSGGRLAYVHLPDTGQGGFTSFNRYFFAQSDRQGAVIDERFNGGGQMADYIIEVLGRDLQSWWSPRYGAIDRTPAHAILGPHVMIANEVAGSGGDALPWMFKEERLGTLVGKRTWGGLVGIGPMPPLMDGGQVTSPNVGFFNPRGEWEVENAGVAPDVEVDQDPAAVAAGRDPQLETAVAIALRALEAQPPAQPRRPAYPVYPQR